MSVSAQLQQLIAARLGEAGVLRVPVTTLAGRDNELSSQIEQAAARTPGLCVVVKPTLPEHVIEDAPFVFFDRSEVRVRIIEQPAVNATGADAFQLAEDIAQGLHWHAFPVLAHPLQLAGRVTESVSDEKWRLIDVIFTAAYQLPRRTVPSVPLQLSGTSISDDLKTGVIAQLSGALAAQVVPVLGSRTHDLASAIETSGHQIKIEVLSPLATRAMQGNPEVFFEGFEVRVRITEQPALNNTAVDGYDLVEDVATTLHWQPFTGLLAYPLQLAAHPTQLRDNPETRQIDVIFNAAVGFA